MHNNAKGHVIKKGDPEWPGKVNLHTSLRHMLSRCKYFRDEVTELQHLANELRCKVVYSPKAHPELAGIGIEYAWGYMKHVFKGINSCNPKLLEEHVRTATAAECGDSPLNIHRTRKFVREAREYKHLYAESFCEAETNVIKAVNFNITEKVVKEYKCHRSALDVDFSFIVNS